ncbi:MAG: hypothetical protein NVSMB9_11200 [Isosphaeraceae bacterium]
MRTAEIRGLTDAAGLPVGVDCYRANGSKPRCEKGTSMKTILARCVRGFLAASAVLAVGIGFGMEARAGFYAYAEQQTSTYTFTGATVGTIKPLSSTSGAQTGAPTGSEAHSAGLDALQSYVGPGPRPAENTFTPLGQVNPDFVRGDSLVTTTPSFTTANVAEGFLNGNGNSAGSGSWSVSAPITLSQAGTVTLGFAYMNNLTLVNAPVGTQTGTVAADYGYIFNIQDGNGFTVYSSAPTAVNRSLSLSTAGTAGGPGLGTLAITSTTLAAGTYTATISGSEHVFLDVVPEPGSVALMAIGVCTLAGGAIRKGLRPAQV